MHLVDVDKTMFQPSISAGRVLGSLFKDTVCWKLFYLLFLTIVIHL